MNNFSKNKICGIILFIQGRIKTDKEWKKAAAESIGYSTQYVSKKSNSKQAIQELLDNYNNQNQNKDQNDKFDPKKLDKI